MSTTPPGPIPPTPAELTPDTALSTTLLTVEEFAALVAIDGSMRARRPPAATEIRLRRLGLIEPHRLSRLPIRTAAGQALILAAGVPCGGPLRDAAAEFSMIFGEVVPA